MDGGYIDIYCERTAPGLWAEPLNAITNLAFVVAALWLMRGLAGRANVKVAWDLWLLSILIAAIGVGSGLWHLYATPWAAFADVLPIGLFITLYLGSFLSRIGGLRPITMIAAVLGFQTASVVASQVLPSGLWNGSVAYLPALLLLAAVTGWAWRFRPAVRTDLVTALGLFCLALTARTMDAQLCSLWPIGTHFLWHLLNAEVLRRLVQVLLGESQRTAIYPGPS